MTQIVRAYFDDSGTHSTSRSLLWSGFMADSEVWDAIDVVWSEQLRKHGLPYFHSFEIENATETADGWSRAKSDNAFYNFRQILVGQDILGLTSAVRIEDWKQVIDSDQWLKERMGGPKKFAFNLSLQMALKRAKWRYENDGIDRKVAFVYDLNDRDTEACRSIAEAYRETHLGEFFDSIRFEQVKQTVGLQAADMLAYESYLWAKSGGDSSDAEGMRIHLKRMLQDIAVEGRIYDAEALRMLSNTIIANERA